MTSPNGIGIDWKLVLAQVVNFALLAWLLAKLLYRPMIRKIEEYERDLKAARDQERRLDDERRKVEEERKRMLSDMKERSRTAVEEAEQVAEKITAEAKAEAERRVERRLEHVDELIASQRAPMEERYKRDLKSALRERLPLALSSDGALGAPQRDALQEGMLPGFLEALGGLEKSLIAGHDGEIVVRTGRTAAKKQEKEVVSAMRARFGKDAVVRFEEDPSVVAGFRTEIGGTVAERSIVSVLTEEIDAA